MGLSILIPLAIFHCDIINRKQGKGVLTVSTSTHDPRGIGTDPKDNSYHDNSPGKSDLFAAYTDAANNR